MTEISIEALIAQFSLKPLPVEGGMFARTYLSQEVCPGSSLPAHYDGLDHPFGSAILMLFTPEADSFSAMHRLKTDEVFHFYLGDPFDLLLLYPDGTSRTVTLGQDVLAGQHIQFVVPAGVWQGSRLNPGGRFALFGTTMAPAFAVEDFEAAERDDLIAAYPRERERITDLTRNDGERFMPPGSEG